MVIILLRTMLADMSTTHDRGPVTKTVYPRSLSESAQPTTRRAAFAEGSSRPGTGGRSQLMMTEGTRCKLGLLGGAREDSARPWPGRG